MSRRARRDTDAHAPVGDPRGQSLDALLLTGAGRAGRVQRGAQCDDRPDTESTVTEARRKGDGADHVKHS